MDKRGNPIRWQIAAAVTLPPRSGSFFMLLYVRPRAQASNHRHKLAHGLFPSSTRAQRGKEDEMKQVKMIHVLFWHVHCNKAIPPAILSNGKPFNVAGIAQMQKKGKYYREKKPGPRLWGRMQCTVPRPLASLQGPVCRFSILLWALA